MRSEEERRAYREKLLSLNLRPSVPGPKKTTDVHDNHTVTVTEHWNDRADVLVKPETIKVSPPKVEDHG